MPPLRTILVLALVAGPLLSVPTLAQAPASPAPAGVTLPQFQAMGRGKLLDRDADGDGKISKAEFANAAQGRKAKAGASATAMAGGRMAGRMGDRLFQRFDINGDLSLDKSEIDAMLARRFERMDANHDGILTVEERQAARGGMRGRMDPGQQ